MNRKTVTDCADSPDRQEHLSSASCKSRALCCVETAPVHPYKMGREFSLGKNRQFQYVYRRGKSYPAKHMVLVHLRARNLQVGFSVSSKVGNSVVRSRVKRRMFEDFRMLRPRLKPGKYIFIARVSAAKVDAETMGKTMEYLLRKAKLFKQEQI